MLMPPSERDTNTGTLGSSNSKLGSSSSSAVSSTTTTVSSGSSSDTKRCTARNSSSVSGTTSTSTPSTSTPTSTTSMPTSSTSRKTGTRPGPRPSSSLVTRYRTTLNAISARTGTALPSLVTSFVVLHEVTAVVPLVGVFFACRSLGVGERLVSSSSSLTDSGLLDGFKKKQELGGVGSGTSSGSGLSDNGAVKFDKGETVVGVVGVNDVGGGGGGGGGGGVGRDADNTDVVDNDNHDDKGKGKGWVDGVRDRWLAEGEAWVGRVGRYYGILGFEKSRRSPVDSGLGSALGMSEEEKAAVAADVANAVVAYCATKALLPIRIGFSLYLAPSFSRRLLDPAARRLVRLTKIFR